ncbi:hypothetical protein EIL87_19690 [Saccharopolyspora rhizosphaerae]|uniref:Uncharacterized protein n=1 Tax=Saccharopolyspora rhizosphaerae TaxID=2492662 RepID=A0A3R8QL83_9PSEU|nr:hypothetical protein [Saccharopolyspora rhizosphaerae]RRO14938.1 hypothetical protein EIL87_19690 [Saccharopolyspora rhizosphaerae]
MVRTRPVLDRWPRLSEGPVSIALRGLWLPVAVIALVACVAELLVIAVVLPCALVARASGLRWRVEVRGRGELVAVVRVAGLGAARRLRRALREHLDREASRSELQALLRGSDVTRVEVGDSRWRWRVRALSPYGRRRWFLWRRKTSFEDALDSLPDGGGDDPISFLIAVPFLLWAGLLLLLALLEAAVQLALSPVVLLLRLVHLLPWPVELVSSGVPHLRARVRGVAPSIRERRALTADHALQWSKPALPEL